MQTILMLITIFGGTGSGGDINRCGGRGMITPMFRQDSYFDVISCYSTGGGGGGGSIVNTYGCWRNPNFYCSCLYGYHTVFGSNCGLVLEIYLVWLLYAL